MKDYITRYSGTLLYKDAAAQFSSIFTDYVAFYSYTCVIKYFSFADYARDVVLIHVFASNAREV